MFSIACSRIVRIHPSFNYLKIAREKLAHLVQRMAQMFPDRSIQNIILLKS